MSYSARVLADSESPDGVRLTTLEVTFPRFILAEVNTHRTLSRNSASSRAIPTEKLIERVRTDPFIPETFNKRVKGMGVGEAFGPEDYAKARYLWEQAAADMADSAEMLADLGLDKSRANRLLEPFLWHTAIISSTEWDNFFGLRDHPAAQPEFQIVAKLMREAMELSEPQKLDYGWWHLPLITDWEIEALCRARAELADHPEDLDKLVEEYKLVSTRRCARVSFDKHTDTEPWEESIEKAKVLMGNGHFSPLEHVARPFAPEEWTIVRALQDEELARAAMMGESPFGIYAMEFYGNFRGWVQFRKEIPHEDRFDLLRENAAIS